MPPARKQKSHLQNASARRLSNTKIPDPFDSSDDEYTMDVDDQELPFNEKLLLTNIGDLAEMCKSKCDAKYLSTLLYISFRFLDVKWEEIDRFLKNIGFMTAQTSHKWTTVFIEGDYEEFSNDLCGGNHTDSFYDTFPEIEADARSFVVQACSQKSADFKAVDLAQFIDTKYYELAGIKKQNGDDLIRSERSCRPDLRRWEAKFEANSQHPYFERHERDDVVKHRHEFINYFLTHKGFYYTITDGETPMWNFPTQNPPRILMCKTHTTKAYSLHDFGKTIGTRCPIEQVEFVDENGATKVIDCYFKEGAYKDQSKGLVELAKELSVQLTAKAKLDEICIILSEHRAFQNASESHFIF
ncbi:unnamed protein product [Rotaria sordida]|uniref:Uncharacterized protein n=2 Tax=Rotaria sordida TaxID=392033 RepID=A0A820ADU7_9BILA|nr:unnamed protein product [Rotaria sordida]